VIKDPKTLSDYRKEWNGVEALRTKLQVSAFAAVGSMDGLYPFALEKAAHNLPFIHAFSVLNNVLITLRDQGDFTSKGTTWLGKLVKASKNTLPWNDFQTIKTGVNRRNGVAHRADLLETTECWKYVDAIKLELTSWGIV